MSAPDDVFGQRHSETFPSATAPDLPRESMPPIPSALTKVALALRPLDVDARNRVLGWACQGFGSLHETAGGEPRKFWLDDMPATGDLIHVDGQKVPVTYVHVEVDDGRLSWDMAAVPGAEPEAAVDESPACPGDDLCDALKAGFDPETCGGCGGDPETGPSCICPVYGESEDA
jgi:hypothetical protein